MEAPRRGGTELCHGSQILVAGRPLRAASRRGHRRDRDCRVGRFPSAPRKRQHTLACAWQSRSPRLAAPQTWSSSRPGVWAEDWQMLAKRKSEATPVRRRRPLPRLGFSSPMPRANSRNSRWGAAGAHNSTLSLWSSGPATTVTHAFTGTRPLGSWRMDRPCASLPVVVLTRRVHSTR